MITRSRASVVNNSIVAEPSGVPGAAIEVGYPLEPEGCRGSQGFRPLLQMICDKLDITTHSRNAASPVTLIAPNTRQQIDRDISPSLFLPSSTIHFAPLAVITHRRQHHHQNHLLTQMDGPPCADLLVQHPVHST